MKKLIFSTLLFLLTLSACNSQQNMPKSEEDTDVQKITDYIKGKDYKNYAMATFAGGCFWCTEASFERINGVVDVISGYSGGSQPYPTYKKVGYGETDHAEAIQIYYNPEIITYKKLLEVFFVAHDPTTLNRQGPDVGEQYRSAIYYRNETEKETIQKVIATLDTSGKFAKPIVTEVAPFKEFWTAEAYHQDYYEHNPDNPYVQNITKPKVKKILKVFKDIVKNKYKD